MRVGVPTEIREEEYRVALTPAGTKELTIRGHEVLVQRGAGEGSLIADEAYVAAGARIVPDAEVAVRPGRADRQGQGAAAEEIARLEPRHILFTYLHLAPDRELTDGLRRERGHLSWRTRRWRRPTAGDRCWRP